MSQFFVVSRPVSRREVLAGAGTLAFSALALSACQGSSPGTSGQASGGTPRRGGVLTFAANAASTSEKLDPQQASGPSGYLRNASVFDTLTAVRSAGWQLEPRLAESWEPSSDLTSWRFTLRKGVTFHDGRPLTAKDVVWTFRRVLDQKVGSGAYSRFARTMTPEGLTATDSSTVTITLKSPDSLLPYAFADPHTSIVKDGQTTFNAATCIGTGPYKLVSWRPGQSLELTRNPHYWDSELPYLDGIRRVDATEEATATQGVLSGDYDVAEAVSYAAAAQLGTSPKAQLIRLRNVTSLVIVMDTTQAPFNDLRVRQACKLAVDRKVVLNTVFAGFGDVTNDLMLPPSDAFYPDGLGTGSYDPDQAKSLLAAAGHPGGLDLDLLTYGTYTPLAVAYADTAKAAGIRAKVQQGNPDTFFDVVYLHDKFYTSDWQQFFPPDLLWYAYGSDATYNESKLKLTQIDELYNKALATTDPAQQKTYVKEIGRAHV